MTVWISHRGVKENGVEENTFHAFEAAVKRGFRSLETDLRLTADHQIVLSHDPSFSRLSQNNIPIVNLTRKQIEAIRFSDGQPPYFFEDFLQDHSRRKWTLDIKPETGATTLRVLLKLVNQRFDRDDFIRRASFVVWTHADLQFVEQEFKGAKIYATKQECWRAGLAGLWFGGFGSGIKEGKVYSIIPELFGAKLFQKAVVDRYHARGARVLAFLPRSEEECRQALAAGVDEILSDGFYLGS
jgi:glycerophosphoryl diester phosphodiesterase